MGKATSKNLEEAFLGEAKAFFRLRAFASLNGCDSVAIEKTEPRTLRAPLQRELTR